MCYNGQTYVNTCIPVPGAAAGDATYVVDLTHYTCGNRKICANGAYPVTGDLNFKAIGAPQSVGNNGQGQCGCSCPVTENVWATVSVPVTDDAVPTVTAGETIASPTNLKDCCSITNAVSLVCSFNLASAAAASGGAKK